jgi:hypothetical protein
MVVEGLACATYNRFVKKRALILGGIAVACVALARFLWHPLGSEPRYRGKPLSAWLISHWDWSSGDPKAAQRDALRKMGTNSIPFLLSWVAYPGPSKLSIFRLAPSLNLRNTGRELAEASFTGFQVLEADAATAIPELVRLTKGTNLDVALRALTCIEATGRPGIPVVFDILTNRAAYCPDPVFTLLGTMPYLETNVDLIIPGLLQCLHSPRPWLAATAANLLGQIHHRADVVVPALAQRALDPDKDMRCCTIHALGLFQESARPAIPTLLKALHDPELSVRAEASYTLEQITPEYLDPGPIR